MWRVAGNAAPYVLRWNAGAQLADYVKERVREWASERARFSFVWEALSRWERSQQSNVNFIIN